MNLPTHIQKAVDHGLLDVNEEGKVVSCKKDEVETIMGIARVVEKIQPTTTAQADDTTDQEAIVLCRVLNAPSGIARELWSQLRIAFGVSHDQGVPSSLWSNPAFRAVGIEIDRTYLGQLETQLISRDSLIRNYSEPSNQNKIVQPIEFTQVVANLTAENAMAAYGDEESEWAVALDLLRKARVRAIYNDTIKAVEQAQKADTKLEKQIEFQQGKLMECLGMLRGSVGQQGNAKTSTDILYGVNGKPGLLDKIMDGRQAVQPVSTGIQAMDLDMEGGVYPGGGDFSGGRLFTLAARTGVGKCQTINTPIIMADGSVCPVQDVKEGDLVLGPDGTPRRVYGLARGRSEMYRVTQVSGDAYTVNDAHILSLRVTGGHKNSLEINKTRYYGGDIVNIEIQDYLKLSGKKKHLLKGWKPEAVEFHGAPVYEGPLTPYLAGAYLGDGTARAAQLHLSDSEIIDELRGFCKASGYRLRETANPGCFECRISTGLGKGGNPVLNWIRDNDFVGQGKYIPDSLKRGTIQQRLEVLAGILDTDGCISNGCFDIVVKEQRFASDIAFVARSLGLAVNQKECQKSIKSIDFTGTYHRLTISGDTDKVPTRVARKQCGPRKQIKNALNTGIKVESVGIDDYYGFALEGPDRLYLMGDFTVTHNTILAAQAAVGLASGGLKVGFVSAELDEDEICSRIWSCATRSFNPNTSWASVGDIKQPGPGKAEEIAGRVQQACGKLHEAGGEIIVEAPWGADVDNVINILRSMKAKDPEMRAAVIDHFHALSRHKGSPSNESGMMEDRAYKLMTVAKELGIDLIVLAQMNRVGMDALSSKQAPGLDQIRGTDALSHVSHAVWIARRVTGDDQPSNRNLEFWHAKTRGRQAIWNGTSMRGTKDFIEMSTLRMDYAHSGVEYDDTENKVN